MGYLVALLSPIAQFRAAKVNALPLAEIPYDPHIVSYVSAFVHASQGSRRK